MKVHLVDFSAVCVADIPVFQSFLQETGKLLELEEFLPDLGLQLKTRNFADPMLSQPHQILESRAGKIRVQIFSNRLSVEENILTMKGGKAYAEKFIKAFFHHFADIPISAVGLNFGGFIDFPTRESHLKYCEKNLLSAHFFGKAKKRMPNPSKGLSGSEMSVRFNLPNCILGLQIYSTLSRENIFGPETRLFFDANFHHQVSSSDDFNNGPDSPFSKYADYKEMIMSLITEGAKK